MQLNSPQTLFQKHKIVCISQNPGNAPVPIIAEGFKVVVVYENPDAELPMPVNDMLNKLIQACKFKADEVVHVNYKQNPIPLNQMISAYKPEVILIFGSFGVSRNLRPLKKNHPYEISGIKVLCSETLEKLHQVETEKSVLWRALKQMLSLK